MKIENIYYKRNLEQNPIIYQDQSELVNSAYAKLLKDRKKGDFLIYPSLEIKQLIYKITGSRFSLEPPYTNFADNYSLPSKICLYAEIFGLVPKRIRFSLGAQLLRLRYFNETKYLEHYGIQIENEFCPHASQVHPPFRDNEDYCMLVICSDFLSYMH